MPRIDLVKIRRDQASNWTATNPILEDGELGFETDNHGLKVGDGTSTWVELAYLGGADPEIIRDTIATALQAGPNISIAVSDVSDTITISGTTDAETVRDTIASFLVAGTNVTLTHNDAGNTLTITAATDAETVRDTMATALVAGTNVTITPDDAANTITIAATGGGGGITTEEAVDAVAAALVAGNDMSITYDDVANTITLAVSGLAIADVSGLQAALDAKQAADADLTTLASRWSTRGTTTADEFRIMEGSDNGSEYVALRAPASLGASIAVVLPASAGTLALQSAVDAKQNADADLTTLASRWVSASASGADQLAFFEQTTNGTNSITLRPSLALAGDRTILLPDASTTLVGQDTSQALTNKFLTDAKIRQTLNAQTGTTYTLVLTDESRLVTMSNAAANTVTVPPNSSVAIPIGGRVDVAQLGAGQTTIAPGAGVTLRNATGLKAAAQYVTLSLVKIATDEWLVIGATAA